MAVRGVEGTARTAHNSQQAGAAVVENMTVGWRDLAPILVLTGDCGGIHRGCCAAHSYSQMGARVIKPVTCQGGGIVGGCCRERPELIVGVRVGSRRATLHPIERTMHLMGGPGAFGAACRRIRMGSWGILTVTIGMG